MSLVRAIEICDAHRGTGAGVSLGTSRVRWAIESAVAAVFEVGVEELRAPTRGSARAAFARQVAMYLAHVGCGVSLTEVGRLFERDRTTVAHACGLIEDKRDDPDFDYRLDHLERAVSCLIDARAAPMSRVARAAQDDAAGARRLLKGLTEEGAALREAKGCYVLIGPSTPSRRDIRVSKGLVDICLRQDWLERRGGDLALSEAGRAMLRRLDAGDDAFREQHQLRAAQLKEIDGTRRPVLVNDAESPLGWLKSRKDTNGRPLLSDPQFEAGERLRADYWFARLSPRVTANWSALAPSGRTRRGAPSDAAELRDEVIAAKERVMRAIEAVGPELAGVLIDICCELKGREDAEKSHGWPRRAGKVVLQLALSRLARHYGLDAPDKTHRRRRGIRHWGSEDYRPTLDAWQGPGDQ